MPIIIEPGDPEKAKPKHLRILFHCFTCGCRFRIERADSVEKITNFSHGDPREPDSVYRVLCPTCGNSVDGW